MKYCKLILFITSTITPLTACQNSNTSFVSPKPTNIHSTTLSNTDTQNSTQSEFANAHNITEELPAGFVTNGTVDYTDAIQKAINKYNAIIFPGFPLLVNDKGISFHDNQKVLFMHGSQIKLAPSKCPSYSIIRLENTKNIKLINPVVIGDMTSHLGTSGEWGMDISILGADHVTLINPTTLNAWGDGIYIGSSGKNKTSSNINIIGAKSGNNRRNGLSIISVNELNVSNSEFFNNVGTAPKAGIDFEPNSNNDEITGVTLQNIKTYANHYGVEIELAQLSRGGNSKKTLNINIINHHDITSNYAFAMGFVNSTPQSKGIASGNITITNPIWQDNTIQPIYSVIKNKTTDGPKLILTGATITRHNNIIPLNSLGTEFTQYINK